MSSFPIIELTPESHPATHICCAISDKKCAAGYTAKKAWLCDQYPNGYRFKRLDVRGKVFIEYGPAETAWLPIEAPGCMVINCFWIAGQFKGQGYGKRLLQTCADDAQGMNGLVAVTGEKKQPFMSDPAFLIRQGFECVDTAPPFFRLWFRPNQTRPGDIPTPRFKPSARSAFLPDSVGIVAFYSNTCPFTEYWTNTVLRDYAQQQGIPCVIHKITSREQAHNLPVPWIINSVFYNGHFVTIRPDSIKALEAFIASQTHV